MKKFLSLIIKFSIPFLVIIAIYAAVDPLKVIWHYDAFLATGNHAHVGFNKDYVSTSTFDNNYQEQQYNAFIFGNSRSVFYEVAEWKKYLPYKSRPYHFDASGEALYSLAKKVEYIDSKGLKPDDVLIVLDYETLVQDKAKSGHLFEIPPQLEGYRNYAGFQIASFRAAMSPKFLKAYIDFKISGKVKPYMIEKQLLEQTPITYNPLTNEIQQREYDRMIEKGTYYTPGRMAVFYDRPATQVTSPPAIGETQKEILVNMAAIFKKHNTNVKIVINPLYNQQKLNPQDLAYLTKLFGKGNVHDFSGVNEITSDYRNYYEASHYRPHISAQILRRVYD